MEGQGLVEADFQQYYHLNLESLRTSMQETGAGFLRYMRLFDNLPAESRIMKKLFPAGSWTWRDETMSRILGELSELKAITFNAKRKKGQKAIKPDPQFQPDHVKDAKQEYIEFQKKQRKDKAQIELAKNFWQSRNPDVKML